MDTDHVETTLDRRRDGQQWILDWVIQQSGREQNFEYSERRFPSGVKSHAMIPAAMYKRGLHVEALARRAERQGHAITARSLYWRAMKDYQVAEHAIFDDASPDKIYLNQRLGVCMDRIIASAAPAIERVEVPWNGTSIAGLLHLAPEPASAPTVLFLPGMDMSKEVFPDPDDNPFSKRGMNLLCIDGPGQGITNLRGIKVTSTNYENAASAAVDYLLSRSDVGQNGVAVSGISMGSYWAMRLASIDSRVRAVAAGVACFGPKQYIFDEASPRFKQAFMHMAGTRDEAAFDRMTTEMHLFGRSSGISCPCLMVTGQYDPLTRLEDSLRVFRELKGPRELWVLEDEFHGSGRGAAGLQALGGLAVFPYLADWLGDVLRGADVANLDRKVYVRKQHGDGPYGPPVDTFTLEALLPPPFPDLP